ncbi:MAG TPA: alpha-glucan family phosphorylase, partial [Puia sp.]|nr:alpha-glucan family phosphorylase [Puia sp.]
MNIVKKHYGNIACSPQAMEIDGFDALASLALDMRWSWNHTADELWQQLDPALWEQSHNPWLILQTVSGDQLQRQLSSPSFREKLNTLVREQEEEDMEDSWLKLTHPGAALKTVAYFSMEFMLSEALPIYVGGLGNVAGDQLKSASDLGIPVVGIGLLYQRGYFRQYIDQYGNQQAYKPYNDPGQLPITPLRLPNGEWLRVEIPLRGRPLWIRAWEVKVGRVKLYLLDTNDSANLPEHREISGETYGGGPEMRIMQEIVLGIGGWRLLEQLGISPEVCHLNEGHAAFAVLERARSYMLKTGENFDVALAVTRAGNLFTTHT